MKTATDAEGLALLKPEPGKKNETSKAQDPNPEDDQIHILPIRENVYMLVGDGGNIVVQTGNGNEGPFVGQLGRGQTERPSDRDDP